LDGLFPKNHDLEFMFKNFGCTKMKTSDNGPGFVNKKSKFQYKKGPKNMKNAIVKQDDQTTWYENSQLIEEYLESSKKPSTTEEVSQKEKSSLLKLFKTARSKHI